MYQVLGIPSLWVTIDLYPRPRSKGLCRTRIDFIHFPPPPMQSIRIWAEFVGRILKRCYRQQKIDVPLFQEVFCFVWLFRIDESPNICNDQSQAIPFNFESHIAVRPLANSRRQVARTWGCDGCCCHKKRMLVFEVSRHMRPISNTCHPYLWAETLLFLRK